MRREQGKSGLGRSNLEGCDGLGRRREDMKKASSRLGRLKSNDRVGLAALKQDNSGCGLGRTTDKNQNQNSPKATERRDLKYSLSVSPPSLVVSVAQQVSVVAPDHWSQVYP